MPAAGGREPDRPLARWLAGAAVFLAVAGLIRLQGPADRGVLDLPGIFVRPVAAAGRWLAPPPPQRGRPEIAVGLAGAGGLLGFGLGAVRRGRRLHPMLAAFALAGGGQVLWAQGCWVAGGGLWAPAFALATIAAWRPGSRPPERPRAGPATRLAAGLIGAGSLAVLLYRLGSYTQDPFTWAMENAAGLMDVFERGAPALLSRRTWGLSLSSTSAESLVYAAAVWLLTRIGGVTVAAVRGVSALAGLADVYLIYRFARLDGHPRRTGLLAAALLGSMAWHLYFSRAGYYSALTATAVLGAFVLARAAVRTGRVRTYAGLGVLLGLLPHLYAPARLVVLALPAYLAGRLVLGPRRRAAAAGLAVMAGMMALVVALVVDQPQLARETFLKTRGERLLDMVQDPHFMGVYLKRPLPAPPYPKKLQMEAAGLILEANARILAGALAGIRPLAGLGSAVDMEGAIISPPLAVPILLGLAFGLAGQLRRRAPGSLLWAAGLALGLGPALATNEVAQTRVYNGAAFLAYAGALAVARLWDELDGRSGWPRRLAAGAMTAGLALLAALEIGRFYMPPEAITLRIRPALAAEAIRQALAGGARRIYYFTPEVLGFGPGWIRLRNWETLKRIGGSIEFLPSVFDLADGVQTGDLPVEQAEAFFEVTPETTADVIEPLGARLGPAQFVPGTAELIHLPAAWLRDLPARPPQSRWTEAGGRSVYFVDLAAVATMHEGDQPWKSETRFWWGLPKGLLEWGGMDFYVPRRAPSVVLQGGFFGYQSYPAEVALPIPELGAADAVELLGMVAAWGGEPEGERASLALEVTYADGRRLIEHFQCCDVWAHLHARRPLGPGTVKVAEAWGIHLDARQVELDGSQPIVSVRLLDSGSDSSPLVAGVTFVRRPAAAPAAAGGP